ncbi:hypothetical protein NO2_0362 [Candidatus Termititenax persephonae]|uniref:Uncharacterized protein n=1 Tax=Candidatus Termititenax persephonae TaxID=2218525 RepID=A0A388TGC7_9BACT|nr:hypothetical protein NO2_0362 [Candidatus Termititenax persephonae]
MSIGRDIFLTIINSFLNKNFINKKKVSPIAINTHSMSLAVIMFSVKFQIEERTTIVITPVLN